MIYLNAIIPSNATASELLYQLLNYESMKTSNGNKGDACLIREVFLNKNSCLNIMKRFNEVGV